MLASLGLMLGGCALGIPIAVWTAALGACAAACPGIVDLEKDAFDKIIGQDAPPVTRAALGGDFPFRDGIPAGHVTALPTP